MLLYPGFDSSKEDFFKGFDKKKDDQQLFSNDGFDPDAFGATGWGETPTTSEQENTANLQKISLNSYDSDANNNNSKNDKSSHRPRPDAKSTESFESFGDEAENTNNNVHDGAGAPRSKQRRKSNHFEGNGERVLNNDVPHRTKPRRKSYGGKSENAGAEGGGEKKERRMKKEGVKNEGVKNEDEKRKRSLSRSRRKPRRGSTTKPIDEKGNSGGEGKTSKATSIRNMFNRKQANEDP